MRPPLPAPRRALASRSLMPATLGLVLSGCAGGLSGSWNGGCDFSDGEYGEEVFLDLEIDSNLGRRMTGQAVVTVPSQGVFDVPLTGEHTASAAILSFLLPADGGDLDLSFEGSRDADELEGSCELWVPGATAPVMGIGELRR